MPDTTSPTSQDDFKKLISRHDHFYDIRNFTFTSRKTSKPKTTKRQARRAIDVRRYISAKGRPYMTEYAILSDPLRGIFRSMDEDIGVTEEVTVSRELMYIYYPAIVQRLKDEQAKEETEDTLCAQLKAVIAVCDEDLGKDMSAVQDLTTQGKITFDLLWALFPAKQLVYSSDKRLDQWCLYQVRYTERIKDEKDKIWFIIHCWMLKDDGVRFGLAETEIRIELYAGLKRIDELQAYPFDFHPERDRTFQAAVQRGKDIVGMGPHEYKEYSAHAIRQKKKEKKEKIERYFTSSRVIISPSGFQRFEPDSVYNPEVFHVLGQSELTDDQYAICSPLVLGFSFDAKSWGGFAFDRLTSIEWNEGAFDSLVLGEKEKKLIHGLVQQHSGSSANLDDIIKNKGRGLIGLLAGPPGCGKTLTAEAVAETTRKPLYTISSGELGVTPADVEENLLRALELAQMWDAVILLDEAEVFLQQRTPSDLQRNALVAIFLRELEYYQGIMILTTNRVQECDIAFKSRIHFLVRYRELDAMSRRKIWAMFAERASLEVSEMELDDLASHKINGRQIKNAVSSAQTLSLANGSNKLTLEDVNLVLSVLWDWSAAVIESEAGERNNF